MSQDKNKYSFFLHQCNSTPFSEDWQDLFGPITEKTIKAFRYKVENPNNFREAITFAEFLDKQLRKPAKYHDYAYRHFCDRRQIPDSIRTIVDEILNDQHFHLLLWKERETLGIPIKTGLRFSDSTIYTHAPNPQQNEAVDRLAMYISLMGKTWRKFLVYLLVFNHVMPIMHLEAEDLSEIIQNKQLTKLLNTLFKKMKPVPLQKRQTNLVAQLLGINEEIVAEVVHRDSSIRNAEEKARKISRTSKSALRQLLKSIYPKDENNILANKLEAIKRRRLRTNKRAKKQLEEMLKKFEKEFPPSSPKSPRITID